MTSTITTGVQALLEPTITALGLDLEDVELVGKAANRRLLISVDKDGGVGIDEIAKATRAVSALLDESDLLGEDRYTLEVASRGVDRPLTAPRHWQRNIGRLVAVELVDGERFELRIESADDTGANLASKDQTTRFEYDEIVKAVVQIELNRKDV